MTDTWTELARLFERARELDPDGRSAFLDEACAGRADLRARLERMLAKDGEESGLLDREAGALGLVLEEGERDLPASFFGRRGKGGQPAPEADLPRARAGEVLGDFQLVRLLGQGGMAQVWEAQQISLARRVALKLVRPEILGSRTLEMFEREARAGGRLAHPGIVTVHAHGESEGLHWIAMELVEGAWSLREFIEEIAHEEELPTDYYPRVAGLVAEVAEALSAAHEAGVIHRDVKPPNILIGPDDRPRVADFGLARITDEATLSLTGELAGTYSYMSPEQVAARRMGIDHRTDVFSLGAVLYELLTLTRPFGGDTSQQVALQILTLDPPDPRSIRSQVPADLVVIASRCLEKYPGARYQTMAELAADLRRHLAHEPIAARPPGPVERGLKWARRNPTKSVAGAVAATAFAVIAALLAVNLRTSASLEERNRELSEQTARAEVSAEAATFSRLEAERQLNASKAVNRFVKDLLSVLAPSAAGGLGREALMLDALDRAAGQIEARFADEPWASVQIRSVLGRTYLNFGSHEKAEPHLRASLALSREQLGNEDPLTLLSINDMGELLQAQGELAAAESHYREALETSRGSLGDEDPLTLVLVSNIATVLHSRGRLVEAEPYYAEALETRRRVLGDQHPDTLLSINNMGQFLHERGQLAEAEAYYQEALAQHRHVLGAEHRRTLLSLSNMGDLLMDKGRPSEAEPYYRESLVGMRLVLGDEHPDTMISVSKMGSLLLSQDRLAEAEPFYTEALETRRRVLGDLHPDTLISVGNMGVLLLSQGEHVEAEPYYREALDTSRRVLGDDHPDSLIALNNMAFMLKAKGELAEAESHLRDATEACRRVHGDEHPNTLGAIGNLGSLLREMGRPEEAEPLLREALAGARRTLGNGHPNTIRILRQLAELYFSLGRPEVAEALARELVEDTPIPAPGREEAEALLRSILEAREAAERDSNAPAQGDP